MLRQFYHDSSENTDWAGKLESAVNCHIDEAGSKIHTLSRLITLGLKVPDGFFITAQSYRHHISQQPIASLIQHGIQNPEICRNPDSWLEDVRHAIRDTQPDGKWLETISRFYHLIPHSSLAVRSSATCEDLPETSFAGQHDTLLGITDFPSCIQAILQCWASLWTQRAFSYRQKYGIEFFKADMAVLVQRMVRADYAGVFFTADPVTGDSNRMILESCRGLGKILVDGEISPERTLLSRDGRILSQTPSAQSACYILNAQGICCREPLSAADPLCALKHEHIMQLVQSAIQIEIALGCPQDIEWAIEQDHLYILQSRPITTCRKEKSREDRQVWCNVNTAEVIPDVVTPITWSVIQCSFKPMFNSVCRLIGSDLGDHLLVGLVAGRAYFNLNVATAAVAHFMRVISKNEPPFWRMFGGPVKDAVEKGLLNFSKEDLPDLKGSLWKFIYRLPETLWKIGCCYRLSQGKRFLDTICRRNDRLLQETYCHLSTSQLAQLLVDSATSLTKDWDLLFVTGGLSAYPLASLFLKRWIPGADNNSLNQLVRGQEGMEDVQAGFDLWEIASFIKEHPSLQGPLRSSASWNDFLEQIEGCKERDVFLSKWNTFMNRHGHHCRGELELLNPRWAEMPDYVLGMVRTYDTGTHTLNPAQQYADKKNYRLELLNQLGWKLRNPLKRKLLFYLLNRAGEGFKLRENWKSQAVRYLFWMRTQLVALGKRLHQAGYLENAQDIFFLRIEELPSAAAGENIASLRSAVKERRVEYQANLAVTPPEFVKGRFNSADFIPATIAPDTQVFYGISVYPGRVTGPARVILKADDKARVLPGEILVAPFTDPGWTPYFMTAAGIVMDMGGLLSHGSIVAREFGIPAVVNVGPATKLIKTGQKLLLDANQGTVSILDQ